jgi:Fe-S cluster assembly iron-binding protein IscA
MFTVTTQAAMLLKATAELTERKSGEAGIRIKRDGVPRDQNSIRVGFDICESPEAGDLELEQDGLRIFVEEGLRKPLESVTLDVQNDGSTRKFVFV